jgi:hypothetical protein
MALNPVILLGLVAGLLGSFRVYSKSKSLKDTIMAFILWFLAFGTPLHFILVGIYLGSKVNHRVYQSWKHNWGAFMVSLLGIPLLFGLWQGLLTLVIGVAASGMPDAGGAIVVGIGLATLFVVLMLIGLGLYLLSSLYALFKRRKGSDSTD